MGIQIDQLRVAYGNQAVIEGLSLTIPKGCFFTLLGPSGCGKTTLLRALAGFVPVAGGRICFGGQNVTTKPAHLRDIGMVFQDYALFPDKTVFNNVAYGLHARKQDSTTIERKVGQALERVGLSALGQRLPAALSGGQRQRVAWARALVIEPQVLLMDEPLSNLDAKLRLQVRQTIAELQAEAGITTVFVTHDQAEALALSHQIGVMKQGRLEQVGTPAQIYREPASAYVADFVGAANVLTVQLKAPVQAGAMAEVVLDGAGTTNGAGTAGSAAICARAPAALPAGTAQLVARPEAIAMQAPRASAAGQLQGHITSRQFLGEKTSYRVSLGNAQALQVDCHGTGHDGYAVGDMVGLVPDPAATLVLAG